MTTVAFDGRYLAADTMAHRNGVPSNLLQPKIDMCEGFAYGLSGGWIAAFGDLIAWHRNGARVNEFPEPLKTLKGGVMIVELATARAWVVTSECPWMDEEAAPFSNGSGGDFAVGAIDCGRTAMEAVQVASRRDVHTNDTIDFIDLEWPARGVQRWDGVMPSMAHPMPYPEPIWIDGQGDVHIVTPDAAERLSVGPNAVDVGDITARFDEQDAPNMSALYLPDFENVTETHGFTEIRPLATKTAEEMTRSLREGITEMLAGYTNGGTIHWRVRPYVYSSYDFEADKRSWFGYARLCVLPWRPVNGDCGFWRSEGLTPCQQCDACIKRQETADRLNNPGVFVDMSEVKVRGVVDCGWSPKDGYDKGCGVCAPCLAYKGAGVPITAFAAKTASAYKTASEIMFAEREEQRCEHEKVHCVQHAGVIGAADVCEHGYVRRTCTTCAPLYRAALDQWVADHARG
jgi:hypothetical protein